MRAGRFDEAGSRRMHFVNLGRLRVELFGVRARDFGAAPLHGDAAELGRKGSYSDKYCRDSFACNGILLIRFSMRLRQ